MQVVLPDAPRLDVAERHVVGRGQRLASGGEQLANVAETPAGFGDGVVERGPGFATTQMSDAHEPTAGGIVEMSRASREMSRGIRDILRVLRHMPQVWCGTRVSEPRVTCHVAKR